MKKFRHYMGLILLTGLFCFILTGCSNTAPGSTSGNNDNKTGDEMADDVGNAVDDVADGVGDAVDDLVGKGGFDNYSDAHDYFMDTMGSYHSDAKFELRDEDKNLNDYQEGSKGYRFNLYDTSNNTDGELFGEFYVDANSGAIYRKGDDGKVTEYRGDSASGSTGNGSTTGNSSTTGSTGNGSTTGSTGNGSTTGSTGSMSGNQASRSGASSSNGVITTR